MDDLISRQAAIDALGEAPKFKIGLLKKYAEGRNDQWFDDVAALVKLPSAQPEPHWIPVTEDTLPKENRVVVVCGDKGTWDFGTYRGHGDNIHYWHWKKNTYKRVYWWMYKEDALPEPYKGVTE